MLVRKNKNNCNIFSKFLFDDLFPYDLRETQEGLKICYNNQTSGLDRIKRSETTNLVGSSVTLKIENILSLINRDAPADISSISESSWFPVFIKYTDNYSIYKQIDKGYTNQVTRLGIDDAISFDPSSQNWTILSGKPKMTVDWILNSSDITFDPIYGLLCWAKKINNTTEAELPSFPNGSLLKTSSSSLGVSKIFIKLDDTKLLDISKDSSIISNTTYNGSVISPVPNILFNKENEIVDISAITAIPKFKLYRSTLNNSGYILWIADGDYYSYCDKVVDSSGGTLYKASESYLSPNLYKKYTEIYHILTLNEKKRLYSGRRFTQSKFLKKLCYSLATSPIMDGVNHKFLLNTNIQNFITSYVSNPQFANGFENGIPIENEISLLKNCLNAIFKELKNINADSTTHYSNLATNYVSSQKDLFLKLINKYDVNLTMTENTSIKYNNKLKYGTNISINQIYKNYCNKDLRDTVVFNNQEFLFSDGSNRLRVGSDLSPQGTDIKINCNNKLTTVPLADIVRLFKYSLDDDLTLDLGNNEIITVDSNESAGSIEINSLISITETDDPVSFLWELVEGPCGKFSDRNKSSNNQVRYDYSTDYQDTLFYYAGIGRYVIKCTLRTAYGVLSTKKIIYILNKEGYYIAPNTSYSDTGKKLTGAQQNSIKANKTIVRLKTDKVKSLCSSFDKIAIDQKGIFCPMKTGFYVSVQNEIWNNALIQLEGDEKFKFDTGATPENSVIFSDNTQLTLIFKPNNTTIKLNSISLQNIRNGSEECSNCIHIYKDLFVASDPAFGRRFKNPDSIGLDRFDANGQRVETIDFDYHQISTRTAGPVNSYGGYDQSVVDNIGITIPYHPEPSQALPHITGHNLEEKEKICHQVDIPYSGSLEFEKGIFHPSSGWIINTAPDEMIANIKNKSSVLKFNPSARRTVSFIGQGFSNMKSSYIEEENILNIYSSSITLNIDDRVKNEISEKIEPKDLADINQRKELPDHNVNHGYRSLDSGDPSPYSDEYGFSASFEDKTGTSCSNQSSCIYSVVHKGPKLIQNGSPAKGELRLQNAVADGWTISDIEVKLNFLNYINTKNLIIWLDIDLCAREAERSVKNCVIRNTNNFTSTLDGSSAYAQGAKCKSPYEVKNLFQNEKLGQYITDLNIMNIPPEQLNSGGASKLRLYLLNKEFIQNNQYNTSILFSDHAPKNNKPFDYTVSASSILDYQNFEKGNIHLQPTVFASGYTDIENILYSNIIKQNQLNLSNTSFEKFKGLTLFQGNTEGGDGYGQTTFTLNIAVIDDTDEMRVYDNIKNNDILSSLKDSTSKITSNNIYNSLCSWELLLHVNPEGREFTDKDNLGMIKYGEDPSFPGYNFLCDFSTILSDKKYLIPQVNINAPYTYINKNVCRYQDWDIMAKPNFSPIEFPYWAILYIVLNTGVIGGGTGTLVGVLSSIGDPSPGYVAIVNFFKQISRQRILDTISSANDIPYYKEFGQPEKTLINISKDGIIWYKLEASIFNYRNTPILNRNKYSFIKMKKNLFPQLSEFKFTVPSSWENLIDKKMLSIKDIGTNVSIEDVISKETDGTATFGGLTISDGDILQLAAQETESENGLYLVSTNSDNQFIILLLKNNIRYSHKILQYNALCTDRLLDDIETKINDKKIILVESKVMFDLLSKNDIVLFFTKSEYEQVTSTQSHSTNTVLNKGFVVLEGKIYSVLELSSSIPSTNTPNRISFNTNDVIAIFKPEKTIGSTNDELPISQWGLDNNDSQIQSSSPDLTLSTFGVGTYGDGSDDLYKYYLSSNYQDNRLFSIKELFNNNKNDTLKYNKFIITSKNTNTIITRNGTDIRGFEYNPKELNLYDNLFNYNSIDPLTKEQEQTQNLLMTEIKKLKSSIMYIRSSAFLTESSDDSLDYGTIEIGNDFNITNPSIYIPQNIIDILVNRIKFLDGDLQNSLSSIIGKADSASTNQMLSSGNIKDITAHLNALPNDDNLCYKEARRSCYKKITDNILRNRYLERNYILYYLNKHTKKIAPGETYNGMKSDRMYGAINSYQYIKNVKSLKIKSFSFNINADGFLTDKQTYYLSSSLGVLPSNNQKIINIEEHENNNMYWINIDPKQSCSIAEDATAKVLKSVTYLCYSSLGDSLIFDVEQICPKLATTADPKENPDEEFVPKGNEYTYNIPKATVEQNKAQYSTVTEWREHRVEKQFLINSGTDTGYRDVYVSSVEIYDIAVKSTNGTQDPITDYSDISNRVYSIFNLDNTNNLKVRFRNIPRKLKGVDPFYDKYVANKDGVPVDSVYPSPGGVVNNAPAFWKCLDTKTFKYTETTDYLKMQNEMIYRAFFGSIDGMEHKSNKLESLYPFEWIPYEYCTDCE